MLQLQAKTVFMCNHRVFFYSIQFELSSGKGTAGRVYDYHTNVFDSGRHQYPNEWFYSGAIAITLIAQYHFL